MAPCSTAYRLVLCVVAVSACISSALGSVFQYPQCRNSQPPFRMYEHYETFCGQYSEYGCCTGGQVSRLEYTYDTTVTNFTQKQLELCGAQIKEMMCQECSPYAMALSKPGWTLPRLCDRFCMDFYSECRSVLHYVDSGYSYIRSLESADAFCRSDTAMMHHTPSEYCYPQILNNATLNEELKRFASMTDGCLCLQEFASRLSNPVLMRAHAEYFWQAYVAEKNGVIYIYSVENPHREPITFMNLSDLVHTTPNEEDERGLLGFAFHPNFTTKGKFYVYYSVKELGKEKTRISEFVSVNDHVNLSSERIILELEQPYATHNGGEILFGIDGFLYVFVGDGGGVGDPHGNAQNKSVLLGKILRIDINQKSGELPYTIPKDNPFVDEKGARAEIYAYGIRNMWRADVDEGDDTGLHRGRIIGADVGEDSVEEINIIQRGGNYGWNSREGFDCYDNKTCGKIGPEVEPIHVYKHSGPGAIIGGHMYRGCRNPSLHGQYIYGDYVTGKLFSLQELKNGIWKNRQMELCAEDVCSRGYWVSKHGRNILSFGEDAYGEIYVLTSDNAGHANGMIHKLVDPRRSGDKSFCRIPRKIHGKSISGATKVVVSLPAIYILSIALQIVNYFCYHYQTNNKTR